MLAGDCEGIQTSAPITTGTIFVCGRPFDYSTFHGRGQHQTREELGVVLEMMHAAMNGMFAEKIVHCFHLNVWWIVETFIHFCLVLLEYLDPYHS